jgi:hypothetical protein
MAQCNRNQLQQDDTYIYECSPILSSGREKKMPYSSTVPIRYAASPASCWLQYTRQAAFLISSAGMWNIRLRIKVQGWNHCVVSGQWNLPQLWGRIPCHRSSSLYWGHLKVFLKPISWIHNQRCGSGFRILCCFLTPSGIREGGNPDPGSETRGEISGIRRPDHIPESLVTRLELKILKLSLRMRIRDPLPFWPLDPG